MNVTLGDFQLQRMLGRGGMGEVWQARHLPTSLDVAVKVVTGDLARKDRFHRSFRTEVQSMARLNHRGIAVVLDYGRVRADAHEVSRGHFSVDAPYLVMELCGDTLAQSIDAIRSWELARDVLVQVLDALAHAHARSVVHRDIKPQNVLVQPAADARVVYKLADFGLAHPIDDPDHDPGGSGTPKYMAPEQILGSPREQGPWTDLYALGCLAHWLVSGRAPFEEEDSELVLRGHLFEEPPPLRTRFDVPIGYGDWLELLLAKDPRRRLQKAADARHLLEQLDEGRGVVPASEKLNATSARESAPTILDVTSKDSTRTRTERARQLAERRQQFEQQVAAQPAVRQIFAPPHTEDWRRAGPPDRSMKLVGAGISLYGLRPVPMVDRDTERDAIWGDLGRVASERRPRVVALRGRAGSGKSRLAQWVCERADELGAAHVLRVVHSPLGSATDGVGRMVANHLRLVGLDRVEALPHLERYMSPDGSGREFDLVDVLALADLALDENRWTATASVSERNAVLRRFIERTAWDRPAILWIDDAQWGRDALELAASLVDTDVAVLILLTTREEALPERPLESAALDELRSASKRFRDLPVGPLSNHDHRELIGQMLQLDDEVAAELATRTQGNPLFAVQLVGDWVEREVLVPGERGFELRDTKDVLPDSIHNLWSRRIDRCVERYAMRTTAGVSGGPHDIERSLWVAAVLGQEVDLAEWNELCDDVGAHGTHRLLEELVRLQLAERTPSGLRFVHGMLAESLLRRADAAGDLYDLHRAAAEMLGRRAGRTLARRVAEHYLAAEEWDAALEPLLVAAEELSRGGEFVAALAIDARREDALNSLREPDLSVRRVMGWTRRARTHLMMGDYAAAQSDIDCAGEVLERLADPRAEGEVLWTKMLYARHVNETTRGARLAERALALFESLGDQKSTARTLNKLGEFSRRRGDLPASIEQYDRARRQFEELDEPYDLAWSLLGLGTSQRHVGEFDQGRENITTAAEIFKELGSRLGLGNAFNELGEVERAQGNYVAAENHYRRALNLWGHRGHTEVSVLQYNIALTLLCRSKWVEARELAREILADTTAKGHRAMQMLCWAALACSSAALGDWDDAVEQFERFVELHDEIDLIEPDVAELATILGRVCVDEKPEFARRALAIARAVYEVIEDDRLAEVEALIQQSLRD